MMMILIMISPCGQINSLQPKVYEHLTMTLILSVGVPKIPELYAVPL